jgi:hypothetical protein
MLLLLEMQGLRASTSTASAGDCVCHPVTEEPWRLNRAFGACDNLNSVFFFWRYPILTKCIQKSVFQNRCCIGSYPDRTSIGSPSGGRHYQEMLDVSLHINPLHSQDEVRSSRDNRRITPIKVSVSCPVHSLIGRMSSFKAGCPLAFASLYGGESSAYLSP